MRSSKLPITLALALLCGCGGGASSGPTCPSVNQASTPVNGGSLPGQVGSNVMILTVNGSTCGGDNSYVNKPCVTVTICPPGSSSGCQTINDILLDTGSYGLRVFKTILNAPLAASFTPVTSGGNPVAECVAYADGTADWGPVQKADVVLGGEPNVTVPIQIIDSTFAGATANCSGTLDTNPSEAGFNGILGVGLFAQDCGDGCTQFSDNGIYFSCSGSSCTGASVSLANQVANPVTSLPSDNNGVILEFPSISLGGVASVNGYLVLGIGTKPNNQPSGVTTFAANQSGNFSTCEEGHTFADSFIDSGSNALYFSAPVTGEFPDCGGGNAGFYCPVSSKDLTANTLGTSGSPASSVAFTIGNVNAFDNANQVFIELAGDMSDGGASFDWGLPFFLGRNVYVGYDQTTSSLGTGPYWSY